MPPPPPRAGSVAAQTLPLGACDLPCGSVSRLQDTGPARGGRAPEMASIAQCRTALEELASRLRSVDEDERKRHAFDRSLSCYVPDLDVTFSGQLSDGHITDITTDPAPKAQIRLTSSSDDLVALTEGDLNF